MKVQALVHAYGETRVLNQVDLTIHQGERLGIMGPSGSGKSTLLNCLGGIDLPRDGSIHFRETRLDQLQPEEAASFRRRHISTIFQFFHLLPTLTVSENIEFPLQLLEIGSNERSKAVAQLVSEVGLEHRRDAFPDQLSGGEMQRVAIARALVHQPDLILADEPTGNLDSQTGETILNLLESLTQRHQTALVLVTHSEAATRICHRVIHMKDGRIQRESSPAKQPVEG